jgi:glycosyltransferase involved in cell wall biosynthesis
MLKVVHISSTDNIGGAAIAANRLHCSLDENGIRSTMFVALSSSESNEVIQFNPSIWGPPSVGRILYKLARRINHRVRSRDRTLFSLDWTVFGQLPVGQIPLADVYNLHWTADLLDFRMLRPLADRAPIVWTFHDMNAFTGGCHYDRGCGRFADECGECPIIGSSDSRDVTRRVIRRKKRALSGIADSRLALVSPSRWMADEARRSSLFGRFESLVIPYGLNLHTFRPVSKEGARRRFGLESDERVLLFVADHLRNPLKGWSQLKRALAEIPDLPHFRLLTVGSGDTEHMSAPTFRHLGRLADPEAIRDAYNAADLFVIPSLYDNFPNTVLESLACGTPVVGFATGGVVDAVEHGVTGMLAPTGNVKELAACIINVLSNEVLRESMARAARARAASHYGLDQQAKAYIALYERLANTRDPVATSKSSWVQPSLSARL